MSVFYIFVLLKDRNPVRGQSTSLSPMGPGMVPHHNYGIPSESYPSGGRLAYRSPGLTQLMTQMGPPLSRGLSNDMGPPIFMPCEYSPRRVKLCSSPSLHCSTESGYPQAPFLKEHHCIFYCHCDCCLPLQFQTEASAEHDYFWSSSPSCIHA